MRLLLSLGALIVLGLPICAQTRAVPEIIQKSAAEFDRFELDDNAKADWIRTSGNLSGRKLESAAKQPAITGWVEYDFSISQSGWYVLSVQPDGAGHEFLIDEKRLYHGEGPVVANLWLSSGKHTLRIQRTFWSGFGTITGWKLTPSGKDPSERISISTTHKWQVLRKGESLPLIVDFGGLRSPVKISLLVREVNKPEIVRTVSFDLPVSGNFQTIKTDIPGDWQGMFTVSLQINGQEYGRAPLAPIRFGVVDTTPTRFGDDPEKKQLLVQIDAAAQSPDFFKGGETRVIQKPWGSYRESGDVGYLQNMNSKDPSWFAYKFQVDDPSALYWMEFDYPDDAKRTFLVVPRSDHSLGYAGPGTGPDAGREYSLTNRMQTMGIYFWPNSTNLRAAVLQPQSGLRAAISKIRIYKVDPALTPLPRRKNGRDFVHWYEEGSSFMGFFGAPNKRAESSILAAENWAKVMSHMGSTMLMPTFSIYQMGLYPSAYNPSFTDSHTFDVVRVVELMCEKYGLKFAAEFHPEGRSLKSATFQARSPDSIFQFNRRGKVCTDGPGPKFNFLHPEVEAFAVGLLGEFVDRYGDSPAFDGVSIRLMGWQNTGFGNFDTLDWGYGDYTISLFEHDTKISIPVANNDSERFEKRYQWLMANARESWINWRCDKATQFFAKVSARIRQKHPQTMLYLNDFLTPNPDNATKWYEGFLSTPKEAGIDPVRLARVPGVELINSMLPYGRRNSEAKDQRFRDALINPAFLGALTEKGKPARFMATQAYFEATEAIAPPCDMDYPEKTPHGWMSGCVNPAGRHYLERLALPLAEYDAVSLGDGGNGYTLGQPLLREFLREYLALPRGKFEARADARDPVAVWERCDDSEFFFYAVNRERYPVKIKIEFTTRPTLRRLSTGETMPLEGNAAQITLEPYAVIGFGAEAGTRIGKITETIPDADLKRVLSMMEWLLQLDNDIATGKAGAELTPEQKKLLANVVSEAKKCIKEGRYWRARTLQEDGYLREIYFKCSRIPPLLDQIGSTLLSS